MDKQRLANQLTRTQFDSNSKVQEDYSWNYQESFQAISPKLSTGLTTKLLLNLGT